MKLGNTLIVAAHLDDIEVGIGGFLSNLSKKQSSKIITYTACNGLNVKDSLRLNTFFENMHTLNIKNNIVENYCDTELTQLDIKTIKEVLTNIINNHEIETVFVVNNDVHNDHKLIYNAVKICTRQTRTAVKRLYAYQVYTDFNLNEFNCSLPFDTNKKYKMLKKYNQNINVNAIKNQDKVFGSATMNKYAEKTKIVFDTI